MSRQKTAAAAASAALLCLAAGLAHAAENAIDKSLSDERPEITMAVLDTMVNPFDAFLVQETLQALQANLPEYEIRSVSVAAAEADAQIAATQPDFLFAPAAFGFRAARKPYALLRAKHILRRRPKNPWVPPLS